MKAITSRLCNSEY